MSKDNPENFVTSLYENTILVTVDVRKLGIRRKVRNDVEVQDSAGEKITDDKGLISATKKLVDSPEFDAIVTLDQRFYGECQRRVLPSHSRRGTYLLPTSLFPWFEEAFEKYIAERAILIDAFCVSYDAQVEDAKVRLGAEFDEKNYPSREEVRAKFYVAKRYESSGVPQKLMELDPRVFASEKAKLRESFLEAAVEVRLALREAMLKLVSALQYQLTPSKEGERKRFTDASVENLKEFLTLLPLRNVTGDEDLGRLSESAKRLLDGVDRKELQKDADVAKKISDGLNSVSGSLASLVETTVRPKRKFSL